ncbi:MAG TPA: anaerobic ribonucleoside-triphosphate reductase [Bacillota bacterium]|nr:anaerobic ribonucleoside-triphosphate reductase [Bacillota bacterium]
MREKRKQIGEGVDFQRIRRITGYLVGTTDRFNDAKQSEERQRVKHIVRI